MVVSTSADGTTRLWRVAPAELRRLADPSPVQRAALKVGRIVRCQNGATAKLRRNVIVLKFRGRTRPLRGHSAKVTSAAFSHDCHLLVTASLDSDARIWNVATAKYVRTLSGHTGPVRDAQFSPGDRWIVTAGTKAGIWYAGTGKRLLYVQSDGVPLAAATFDPTGRTILTRSLDGTVRTYRCELCGNLDDLLAMAKRRLNATRR